MTKNLAISALFLAILLCSGCCGAPPPAPEQPAEEPTPAEAADASVPDEEPAEQAFMQAPPIWQTVGDVETACAEDLGGAKRTRDALVKKAKEEENPPTLALTNDTLIYLDRALALSSLFSNVHPDKAVRDAAEKCQQQAMKFLSEFQLDREVYDALVAVKPEGLDEMSKRFHKKQLRDYRRAGVDKDEKTRKELAALREKMVATEQDFDRAIREGTISLELTPKQLEGMPEDFLKTHPVMENGKIKVTTDYPDFFAITNYAKKEKTREAIYVAFLSRAHPKNAESLKKLLELRHTYATNLGYDDWASYNAEDKMVGSKKRIDTFIDQVADLARPRMKKDLKDILARKKKDDKNAKVVNVWDRFYYVNEIKKDRYKVDSEVVRSYFSYSKVRDGLLALHEELFGLKFQKVENAPVWHESVLAYDVVDGEEVVGRFYLDMHPREGKYGHAAEFGMITGIKERQLPSASLVCNFKEPSEGAPALMTHGEVTTFFHEFGHLMHQLLSGRQDWVTMSGTNCEWDFVEVPSQLMEEWAWRHEILARFAKHHQTGEVIPKELVNKMREADEFGKGVHIMRQLFYARLSLSYHDRDPKGMDLLETLKATQKSYNPYPYAPKTHVYSNFGHLAGYSSMYYTYMWSLVIAKDIIQTFEKAGFEDASLAKKYRETILDPGGTVDASIMVKNFLGREYGFEAFDAWLKDE